MKYLILALTLLISVNLAAQRNYSRAELAGYNIGLNAINAGISRIIHRAPNENIKDAFIDGLWKGAIGGTINYASKELVLKLHQNEKTDFLWTSRMVNTIGNSITYNAAKNDGLLEYIYFDFAFNRIRFDTRNKFKIQYKVMPIALLTILPTLKDGNFSLKKSLYTLTPYFEAKSNFKGVGSYSRLNHVLIQNDEDIGHEILHTFQHYEYMVVNTFVHKRRDHERVEKTSFLKKMNKYIYWDFLNRVVIRSLYSFEGDLTINKYDNFFEYEANYFSDQIK